MVDPRLQNVLTLAHVGDAVYSLKIRTMLAKSKDFKSGAMHSLSSKFCSARGQAKAYDVLLEALTETESEIAKRAKNARTVNTAKNATEEEYHKATALEAVMGYLHLSGQNDRIDELLTLAIK